MTLFPFNFLINSGTVAAIGMSWSTSRLYRPRCPREYEPSEPVDPELFIEVSDNDFSMLSAIVIGSYFKV